MANDYQNRPNVDVSSEYNRNAGDNSSKPQTNFDVKNYLNVRLDPKQKEKKLTIRLLPMSPNGGTPFVHVHVHNVEVNKELVKQGQKPYKTFLCLDEKKNPDIDHERFGSKCPLCEERWNAYNESLKAATEAEKKALQDKSLGLQDREAVIVRCIERGKENEGVKFWKFNLKYNNSDPYHKILGIAKTRAEEGAAHGMDINILDLYRGRDLNLTIKPGNTENQTEIEVIESGIDTPVTNDPEQLNAWLNDEKKWQDVFTAKPYDYLRLAVDKKIPWYDRDKETWVDKEAYDAEHGNAKKEEETKANEQIQESYKNLNTTPEPTPVQAPQENNNDDLPF
jgi:hypothetical protein